MEQRVKFLIDLATSLLKVWAALPDLIRQPILLVGAVILGALAAAIEPLNVIPHLVLVQLAVYGFLFGAHRWILYEKLRREMTQKEISIVHDGIEWAWDAVTAARRGSVLGPIAIAQCPTDHVRLQYAFDSGETLQRPQEDWPFDLGSMICPFCRTRIKPAASTWGEAKIAAESILERKIKTLRGSLAIPSQGGDRAK